MSVEELVETIEKLKESYAENKLLHYTPYEFQRAFHAARDGDVLAAPFDMKEGPLAVQRCLMCANQIGKTLSAGMETAMHLTGIYPNWWEGHRFDRAITAIVAGKRNETVRDVCQRELLGDPFDEGDFGRGSIPKDRIVKTYRKAGVPAALTSAVIKHKSGKNSTVLFMAFEQGPEAFMGKRFDVGWLDEEPPEDVWTQFIRGVLSRKDYTLYLTFTPEEGMTKVVDNFLNNMQQGQALIRASWDDAPHMTPEKREAFLAQLPPHEREMRSKGIPLMGSGLVFQVPDDEIMCEPFKIPDHFARIAGIDFGYDHPFACVWAAWDRDTDVIYIYDGFKSSKTLPPYHVSAIKGRGAWIPVAWPHDGLNSEKGSGTALKVQYEDLNLLPHHFTNPPGEGQKEGQGGYKIEPGITEMMTRFETGRLKVFSSLSEWFEEKNQYHRRDGKIVDRKDDLMAATRYAVQSIRFAHTKPIRVVHQNRRGVSNW